MIAFRFLPQSLALWEHLLWAVEKGKIGHHNNIFEEEDWKNRIWLDSRPSRMPTCVLSASTSCGSSCCYDLFLSPFSPQNSRASARHLDRNQHKRQSHETTRKCYPSWGDNNHKQRHVLSKENRATCHRPGNPANVWRAVKTRPRKGGRAQSTLGEWGCVPVCVWRNPFAYHHLKQ